MICHTSSDVNILSFFGRNAKQSFLDMNHVIINDDRQPLPVISMVSSSVFEMVISTPPEWESREHQTSNLSF